MAAAGGEENLVKFYFYSGSTISSARKKELINLAYSTARDATQAPKEILVRSDLHNTTSIRGKRRTDPKGWHATISYKDSDQVDREFHATSHGYTDGKEHFKLVEATHAPEKKDDTPRGGQESGKVVWPSEDELNLHAEVVYSHPPERK